MMAEQTKAKPPGGSEARPRKDRVSEKPDHPATLAEAGIDKNLANRARKRRALRHLNGLFTFKFSAPGPCESNYQRPIYANCEHNEARMQSAEPIRIQVLMAPPLVALIDALRREHEGAVPTISDVIRAAVQEKAQRDLGTAPARPSRGSGRKQRGKS
jgi:hypothetical protein